MKIKTLLLLLLPIAAAAQGNYKIYDTKLKKETSIQSIANAMNKTDVLFYGEEHHDAIGHGIELSLWATLIERFPNQATLSLEMFETDCQPVLNEYLNGLIREKNLISDARAWPNYSDYRPLVELAKSHRLAVIAANAPNRYVNRVTRLGLDSLKQLGATAKAWLPPLPIDTADGPYYQKFVNIMGGHSAIGGIKIYQSQNLWDATMAWSIAQYLNTHPTAKILQINGGFHSEEKLGIITQLKKYMPKARVLNIAAYASEKFTQPDWDKFNKLADYVILTRAKPAKADTGQ